MRPPQTEPLNVKKQHAISRQYGAAAAFRQHTALYAEASARLQVDSSRIRQQLRARSPFGIEHNGQWRLPLFQFERDDTLPGLGDVLHALPTDLTALDVAK